ncbi:unnamed protein product, partial [Symbiodinium necroappetens]
ATILPTLFNLGLWLPGGDSWTKLCLGYSRQLRHLLMPQMHSQDCLKVPVPMVHLMTGCWSLELEAVKARLGLLTSLVKACPHTLWAALQTEGSWLQTVQDDLKLIRQKDDDWPELGEAHWPEWWHLINRTTARFKRRVKAALQKMHERACEDKLAGLDGSGLVLPPVCAKGTVCGSCGRQYWTQARLAVHLRDTPACLLTLRNTGRTASETAPGFGSRAWKARADEEFTLAPSCQVQDPLQPALEWRWDEVQTEDHREISLELLDKDRWCAYQDVVELLGNVFVTKALYRAEELEVVDYLDTE